MKRINWLEVKIIFCLVFSFSSNQEVMLSSWPRTGHFRGLVGFEAKDVLEDSTSGAEVGWITWA